MPREDISNRFLSKLCSLEFVGIMVVLGVSWGALSTEVTALGGEISATEQRSAERAETDRRRWKSIEDDQAAIEKEISAANRQLDVLENNQEHFKRRFQEVERTNERVLEILQQQYPGKSD